MCEPPQSQLGAARKGVRRMKAAQGRAGSNAIRCGAYGALQTACPRAFQPPDRVTVCSNSGRAPTAIRLIEPMLDRCRTCLAQPIGWLRANADGTQSEASAQRVQTERGFFLPTAARSPSGLRAASVRLCLCIMRSAVALSADRATAAVSFAPPKPNAPALGTSTAPHPGGGAGAAVLVNEMPQSWRRAIDPHGVKSGHAGDWIVLSVLNLAVPRPADTGHALRNRHRELDGETHLGALFCPKGSAARRLRGCKGARRMTRSR